MDPRRRFGRCVRRRLPRAGGDGPFAAQRVAELEAAPPRRRGWTLNRDVGERAVDGSPAQAGMDPPTMRSSSRCSRLPRAGGDGPPAPTPSGPSPAAPPRRRGWTPGRCLADDQRRGSPAQAGMDPSTSASPARRGWLPRAGGDGPAWADRHAAEAVAPPRRRGWTPAGGGGPRRSRGSPAQAGMDPPTTSPSLRAMRLPRAGGDGPALPTADRHVWRAPPRRRGWTRAESAKRDAATGSPAQAGMDPCGATCPGEPCRLPRAGGDGPRDPRRAHHHVPAPPRRRGWTLLAPLRGQPEDGSPAQAGMDRARASSSAAARRLPRAGGDGPIDPDGSVYVDSAPPRRRGWTPQFVEDALPHRGSPAQAGMDPVRCACRAARRRLPRAGGDGPSERNRSSASRSAPPRRRGWTQRRRHRVGEDLGSPAQAGMDPRPSRRWAACRGLPRAGGDGPTACRRVEEAAMAPPRRRGWTLRVGRLPEQCNGSPAQAGMDPGSAARRGPRRRLPRAGGDGPRPGGHSLRLQTAPPRRRGWTRVRSERTSPAMGSPAQAGMDLATPDAADLDPWLPRAGGDGPGEEHSPREEHVAPPRRRGWTRGAGLGHGDGGGSPAQAGMDPACKQSRRCRNRLPRAGGDGPIEASSTITHRPAPPRRRGWTHCVGRAALRDLGSPAQAGMDPPRPRAARAAPRLPRAGGDGPRTKRAGMAAERAPPRRRGWTRGSARVPDGGRGSPAQAGMDPRTGATSSATSRLPRAGGDGPYPSHR